jgi:hypothetical protein
MNRFFNALLLFFLFPTMAVTVFVGFDLPIEFLRVSGSNLPYRFEAFLIFGLLLLLINIRRTIRRWMGMYIVNRKNKFRWNTEVSKERRQRVVAYNLLEGFVMGSVGLGLYMVTPQAWFPAVALLFCTVDNLVFTIIGIIGHRFRAGVTSKAVILADRDVQLLYFIGLRKVSIHQQSIYFDYIKGLQLNIPVDSIPEEKRSEFFAAIEGVVDKDKVFFSNLK